MDQPEDGKLSLQSEKEAAWLEQVHSYCLGNWVIFSFVSKVRNFFFVYTYFIFSWGLFVYKINNLLMLHESQIMFYEPIE